jgi:hypothetical protein
VQASQAAGSVSVGASILLVRWLEGGVGGGGMTFRG